LRLAVGLGAASLRDVSARLGAPPASGNNDAVARELVRFAEKSGRLAELVAALHEVAPLVEWPEPLADTPAAPAPTLPDAEMPPEVSAIASPPATSPVTPGEAEEPRSEWIPPGRRAADDARSAAKNGVDPRVFVAVAGLMAVAAVFAFLAGRISADTNDEEPPPRADAAARVARAVQTSLENVARTCKVSADPPLESSLLRTAYDVCGVSAERARPHALPSLDVVPTARPAEPEGPIVPAPKRTELPRANTACVDQCNASHATCRRGCGAEPTESSAYGDYQACLGKCLKASSQCRQACAAP